MRKEIGVTDYLDVEEDDGKIANKSSRKQIQL